MFYKQGVTDPDYYVLKFTAIKGRHYCDLKAESFQMENLESKYLRPQEMISQKRESLDILRIAKRRRAYE